MLEGFGSMVLIWEWVARLRFAGYAWVLLGMIIEAILNRSWQTGSDVLRRQAFPPSRNFVRVKDCVVNVANDDVETKAELLN
jgi:hypothetical protein